MELGRMSYRELVLHLCDEHLGLKCMEIIQLQNEKLDLLQSCEQDLKYEYTYAILHGIASGRVNSAHFSKEQATEAIKLIDSAKQHKALETEKNKN